MVGRLMTPGIPMPDFDALYHQFFLYPLMVEHLVRAFIGPAMAAGIDFSRMELVPAEFYTGKKGKGRQRKGDIVWRLPTLAGGEIYLYLHFEFQSTIHWWMSLRAQVYQGLLLQQVVAEKKLTRDSKLPPVLTVVLYNGAEEWTAPTGVGELIGLPADSPLWPWQPQACYYLLAMRKCPEEPLKQRDNLATLLVRLERKQTREEYAALLDDVIDWFRQHPGYDELRGLFTELVRHGMSVRGVKGAVPKELQEIKVMFPGLDWREEDREEGVKEGKASALLRQLRRRFGVLPSYVESLVGESKSDQLDVWLDAFVDASSLEDVFGKRVN